MSSFFEMGGYAGYVWSSYGLTTIALIVLLMVSMRGLKKSRRDLAHLEALLKSRRPRRKKAQPGAKS
ncbi:heme exporter protein CcmD [Thalassospira marina]|uniref:Heme exporter protein D n=1 Tax=Thalassospira marina TaxID=2048283 RepID=A0A2N3KTZ8_9PROT|nr:heme exporter protein CcmD [Thalassospira marina]AUG54117.1 heme exporter protein CcmD [Thalassospira marina]PKR54028.1 heme exporter protein CcmD [Thalassospira marina]